MLSSLCSESFLLGMISNVDNEIITQRPGALPQWLDSYHASA